MAARKQLLMLVHRVPYPPNRGDRIRSYHLLKHLASEFDVHLATLCDEPVTQEAVMALKEVCRRVEVAPVMGWSRWARAARSLAVGKSATEGLFQSPSLHRTVRNWAAETRFDAAFVFCSSMVPYLEVPELAGVRTVVDLVDVDSQKWFDYARHAVGPKRWLFELEGRRLRRLECQAVRRAAAVTLVSEAEAELFRRTCPNDKTVAIPNGVDLDYFRPENDGPSPWTPLAQRDRTNLVFVGALDYRANIDGITWFASEVWPLIRREMPELTLGLVGRNPVPAVQRLSAIPGIRVVGAVPDVRPYVAACDIVIAPLRIARGIQNKVLEAMAMGKPVVCSPAALEGLSAEPGRELLTADSPEAWRDEVLRLRNNSSVASMLGSAGRRFVESHHRWADILEAAARLLSEPHVSGRPRSSLALAGTF